MRSDKLVAVLMVKDEAARIRETTLMSIKDHVNHIIVFDTGSTDSTLKIFRNFCQEFDIKLDIKEGTFLNFADSRNVLLDFADEVLKGQDKWLLHLDAHDELQEGQNLVNWLQKFDGPQSGAYLTQRWKTQDNLDSYYNVRMTRTHKKWRYQGVVHEYVMIPDLENKKITDDQAIVRLENIFLYQDRTKDDDKSLKRFKRDKDMLYPEIIKDPNHSRYLFYLAQTCSCLQLNTEAYVYYQRRLKAASVGFWEENFHSLIRLGDICLTLGHDWEEAQTWYLKSFQYAQRVEPLVKLAEHYLNYNLAGEKNSEWHTCYMYANTACQLTYPQNHILFINLRDYTYKRWHILGKSAWYVGRFKEGKEACIRAIEAENKEIDKTNLRTYVEAEIEAMLGKKLVPTTGYAVKIFDNEIRSSQEITNKYNAKEELGKIVDKIVSDKKLELDELKLNALKMSNSNMFFGKEKFETRSEANIETKEEKAPNKRDTRSVLREKLKKKKMK
jgi:glycosyltransferase involved in cell wall biosynthesis